MADKVQKIRKEVERLMYGFNLEADIASCEDAETEKLADMKYQLCKKILDHIDKVQEEPVSEDLEEAGKEWLRPQLDKSYANYGENKMMELTHFDGYSMLEAIEFGAKWKEEQFEKNRLEHCNSISKEQAELEQGFIDQHLDKYNRMPTFLDAIEYGMRLQKKQMMKNAIKTEVCERITQNGLLPSVTVLVNDCKPNEKVKVILIKED